MSNLHGNANDLPLLELFRAELDSHIPVLNDGLLALERGPVEAPIVAGMMRSAHSIKGAARIVGIEEAVRVAHAMEDCFTAAQEQRIQLTSAATDVLLQGVDALQRICSPETSAVAEAASLDELLERIAAVRDGRLLPTTRDSLHPTASPPPVPMQVAEPCPKERRITLPAELGDDESELLRLQLCEVLNQGPARICVDFAQLDRISTQGLAVLVSLCRAVAGTRTTLDFEGVDGPLTSLMHVSGLAHSGFEGA